MNFFSRLGEKIAMMWRESTDDLDSVGLLDDEDPRDENRLVTPQEGDGQYCRLLSASFPESASQARLVQAWKSLERKMTLTPAGDVPLTVSRPVPTQAGFDLSNETVEMVVVEAFYIDRFAVTNAEFAEFVSQGGYANVDLWPSEVLAHVLQFVDLSGSPGPRFWSHGQPPDSKLDHPVVGVCWYEAAAYAKWAGKRLPTSAQWQQAGCWPTNDAGQGAVLRYPWGNAFDPEHANTWSSRKGGTVSVEQYPAGCTPNGTYQLIGNVWEWVDDEFEFRPGADGVQISTDGSMAEIRGGAFDTYFDAQATCQFRTGQVRLRRTDNIGFRCCVVADDLQLPPDPSAFLEDDER